jgi:hypothetical protein
VIQRVVLHDIAPVRAPRRHAANRLGLCADSNPREESRDSRQETRGIGCPEMFSEMHTRIKGSSSWAIRSPELARLGRKNSRFGKTFDSIVDP